MDDGKEQFEELKKWMAIAHEEGAAFYAIGNKSACSRARKAFDLKVQWRKEVLNGEIVSIHAPTWRATTALQAIFHGKRFQSTPPHGGRHI